MRRASLYLLGSLLLLFLWSAASLLAGSFIVPPPWQALAEAARLLLQAHTWRQILITCLRIAAGFSLALLAGTTVGVLSGLRRDVEALFRPLVLVLQGVPPLLWAIPLILAFGSGHLSPILVIALICFPLVALNVNEGMSTLPRSLEQMLSVFAPGFRARLLELILPHLRPFLGAAVKLGVVLGIKASVIGEYFGANNGIGFQIQAAYQSLQVRRLFAWGLLLILLILAANHLLSRFERLLARRGRGVEWLRGGAAAARAAGLGGGAAATQAEDLGQGERPSAEPLRVRPGLQRSAAQQPADGSLSLSQVCFSYPGEGLLLDRVDLRVGPGEIAVICGDSGVGKTTLLHVAAGLLTPASGTVGRPGRLGIVFQDDRFLPWRSNGWNVAIPLIYTGQAAATALAFARRLIGEAGLGGSEGNFPEELSGGMRKRLGFARCFCRFPEAILLDEPFSGLDSDARRGLWQKFTELLTLHRGPVLIVTHFPEEVPRSSNCTYYSLAPVSPGRKAVRLRRQA